MDDDKELYWKMWSDIVRPTVFKHCFTPQLPLQLYFMDISEDFSQISAEKLQS